MKFFAGVRLLISALILMGLGFGLQACSGGGGGGTTTPTDANPTGYYDNTGTVTVDDDGVGGGSTAISDLQAMINGNRFMMISDAQGLIYDGTITNITTNDFAANVSIFKHGQPITNPNATISGTITEKSKITGTLIGAGAGNSNGTFTLQYALNNNQAADLSRTIRTGAFQWESDIGGAGNTTRFQLDATGTIGGPNSASNGFFVGCNIGTGSFTPIAGTSLYNVTMNVTNCTNNTADLTYVGLAASWTSGSTDNQLAIGVTDANTTYSINGDFF